VLKITQRSQITHESKLYINTTDHSFFTAKNNKKKNGEHRIQSMQFQKKSIL